MQISRQTDEELIQLTRGSDAEQRKTAMEALLSRYKEFVKLRTHSYFMIGADRDDLIQEGMIGLYKAILSFDPSKESSFRSFADICVRRQILTAVKNASRLKHYPLNSSVSLNSTVKVEEGDDQEISLMDMMASSRIVNPEVIYVSREEKRRIEKEKKLAEEKALSRFSEKNMYGFNLDQPYESVHSGHKMNFTPLPKARKAAPPAEALDSALSELNQKTPPAASPVPAVPKEAPDIPKEAFDAPKEKPAAPIPEEKPVREPARVDKPSDTSAPRKKEKEEKEGGHLGVVITLLIALAVGIALFILVRMYLPNITGLISGTPAQNTSSVTTSSQPAAPDEQDSQMDSHESTAAREDTSSASEITAESEPETVEDESIVPEIPEDPNDIAYIASVNEKASADEIAGLDAAAPRLYLSSYGLKISAGTSFNALSYVENAEDDVDSKDRLYTDISVDGLSEMKTSEPGTYELVFYCYDSSGNQSNRAKMTVIVE